MPVDRATPEGTERYRERFAGRAAKDFFRQQQGLTLSSIGIGTYLGNPDTATDVSYTNAIVRASAWLQRDRQRGELSFPA